MTDALRLVDEAREAARRARSLVEQGVAAGSGRAASPSLATAPSPSPLAAGRPTILVVDDDEAIGTAVRGALLDCNVVTLREGAEALARVAAGETFDVILADVMMPRLMGIDLYERVLQIAPPMAQRMVFMTAGATTAREREFLAAAPRTVVGKPLDLQELRTLIRNRDGMIARRAESVIAVIDDDDDSRRLIVRWLNSAKLTCVAYASGSEAIARLGADADRVDAVVLDVTMPGMDGFEVATRLKADPATASIPILMVTAHATREADVTQGMAAGAVDYLAKPFSGPVLIAKVRAACERRRAERELRNRLHSAEELATTDALTGLLNRRAFDEQLATATARATHLREPLAIAVLDIDHFKQINDTYGHPGGDQVLAHFGQALRRAVRHGDQAFRYGGEEFALVLPRCSAEDAVRVVTRIQRDLRERSVALAGGPPIVARFSAGISAAEAGNSFRVEDMVGRADAALYRAKHEGRDRIELET
jgi:diguanylate cyclase (GGDEF)-like protein